MGKSMQFEAERLTIGKASKYLGVSIDSLRRWDSKGIVTSHKSPGGHRYFKRSELDQIGKKSSRNKRTIQKTSVKHSVHPALIISFGAFVIVDIILILTYFILSN